MKHFIRGATLMLMAAAAMELTGCMTTRHTDQTVSQEVRARSSTAHLDSLESLRMRSGTVTASTQTEAQMILSVTSEAIPQESATLDVPILTLRDLPEGAGYTAKDGRAGVELRKEGDNIKITGRCDSISRLYHYYQAFSQEQSRQIDSLQWELTWLREWSDRQAAEINSLHDQTRNSSDKPPETRHWWILAGFVAGLLCAYPLNQLKSKLTTILKK